ncbi:MAG: DUF4340 domain-containing protein [Longimicrobiales bacterium]|nr:DUF4340 domain-containing protein [Longimicrobiales bacterium]
MSESTLKRLVGFLVVITGLWLLAEALSDGSGSIAASGEMAGFFEDVDTAALDTVRITRADTTLTLARDDEGWTVQGLPSDSGAVRRFLAEIAAAEVGELMATNPENHARMGVSADSAAELELVSGADRRTLLVGGAGRRFGTAYVRLPGEDRVHLMEADLRGHLRRGLDQWRNRVMVTVDSSDVARIEVERSDGAYVLVRGDSVWTFVDGGPVQATAVRGILAELSRLVASGFVAESDSIAELPRASTTRAFDAEGRTLAEVSIGEGEGTRWARTPTDPYLYEVSTFRADRLAPPRDDMEPGA